MSLTFAVGLLNLGLLVEEVPRLNLQGIFCFDLADWLAMPSVSLL